MRILVLGGTVFLSRAVAVAAVAAGHEVWCAARGASGSVPSGARHVVWDRTGPAPDELTGLRPDAVLDVARLPSWVRRSVGLWPEAHHVFVSTVNVYADEATPDQRPATGVLRAPQAEDVDAADHPEAYGAMKVACEQAVADGASSSTAVRPGLIVGPEDPTGRFTYWPVRLAEGGAVLAPGSPADTVQVIDVRDLADWLVHLAVQRQSGVFDGVGPALPLGDLLHQVATGVGAPSDLTWVDQEFLRTRGVEPWSGAASMPLWLPRPAYDGMLAHDVGPSLEAGLQLRPVADTSRDTLAWVRATPGAVVTGIDRDRERELLDAWSSRTS